MFPFVPHTIVSIRKRPRYFKQFNFYCQTSIIPTATNLKIWFFIHWECGWHRFIATTEDGLQQLLHEINSNGESQEDQVHRHLEIWNTPDLHSEVRRHQDWKVPNFNYLGSVATSNGRCKKEIRRQISLTKEAFQKTKPILCDRKLSMPIKHRVRQTFVWPVILYGSESWTLNAETRKNIEAAEMSFYSRMLKISCVGRVTNDKVLNRVQKEGQLLKG